MPSLPVILALDILQTIINICALFYGINTTEITFDQLFNTLTWYNYCTILVFPITAHIFFNYLNKAINDFFGKEPPKKDINTNCTDSIPKCVGYVFWWIIKVLIYIPAYHIFYSFYLLIQSLCYQCSNNQDTPYTLHNSILIEFNVYNIIISIITLIQFILSVYYGGLIGIYSKSVIILSCVAILFRIFTIIMCLKDVDNCCDNISKNDDNIGKNDENQHINEDTSGVDVDNVKSLDNVLSNSPSAEVNVEVEVTDITASKQELDNDKVNETVSLKIGEKA